MPGSEIKWRVPGHWTVVQSNGLRVRFEITQDGNTVVGTAYRSPDPGSAPMTGTLNGSIDGDEFFMTIYWPDNSIGKYLGSVGDQGRVEGTTVDQANRAAVASWYGEGALSRWE